MPEAPPPPGASAAPPPLPDDHPGRTSFFRVLLASALVPVLFAVGAQIPAPQQDLLMIAGVWLVGLLPAEAFLLGIIAFARGRSAARWGYLLGALVAGVIGFGTCTVAVFSLGV